MYTFCIHSTTGRSQNRCFGGAFQLLTTHVSLTCIFPNTHTVCLSSSSGVHCQENDDYHKKIYYQNKIQNCLPFERRRRRTSERRVIDDLNYYSNQTTTKTLSQCTNSVLLLSTLYSMNIILPFKTIAYIWSFKFSLVFILCC